MSRKITKTGRTYYFMIKCSWVIFMDKSTMIKANSKDKDMHVVLTFNSDNINYIVYKDNSDYYVSKYDENGYIDNNFSDNELKICERVLNEVSYVKN